MEFRIEKCALLIMNKEKGESTVERELPHQESNRIFGEKERYEYLGILEAYTIKHPVIKEKLRKGTLRNTTGNKIL